MLKVFSFCLSVMDASMVSVVVLSLLEDAEVTIESHVVGEID